MRKLLNNISIFRGVRCADETAASAPSAVAGSVPALPKTVEELAHFRAEQAYEKACAFQRQVMDYNHVLMTTFATRLAHSKRHDDGRISIGKEMPYDLFRHHLFKELIRKEYDDTPIPLEKARLVFLPFFLFLDELGWEIVEVRFSRGMMESRDNFICTFRPKN
ncbi:MAG: hypothetical protein DI585_01060 [Pseudomonas fluorescens]|nr:MAG: hypothetical protein DI585_01060 [Pseudomonas fluorescens]